MKYQVTSNLSIDENEFDVQYVQASGPGGQNVNKVATAVQLSFDVRKSPSLPEDVRIRLSQLAGNRLTTDGRLIIQARRFRTQEQNRQDAIQRLLQLVLRSSEKPKERYKTRPTLASKKRRLELKRLHSRVKRMRSASDEND